MALKNQLLMKIYRGKDETKCTEGKLDGLVKLLKTFQGFYMDDEEIQKEDNENPQKIRKKKKDEDQDCLKLTLAKDLRLSSCSPAQLTHQGHEACLDSPMCKPSGNTDVIPVPKLPVTLKGQERAEVSRAASQRARARPSGEQTAVEGSSSHKSGITEPSTSSAHPEDDAPRPQRTCLLMGQAFHRLLESPF
ncbi:uncharacterized protein C12orf71 homolog isoform X1 [Heterocephalus glaber]|uniref:Uncharacterized protein C12orf71 homolog isoform X1 n=1 Tax=Heterocephalus glaber TaxID=10181 RepID=A0AAX6R8R7_HETGA|nr:uncharacterized protein C12orf71 homolog isoform X1 [Heterocephalus glaber]